MAGSGDTGTSTPTNLGFVVGSGTTACRHICPSGTSKGDSGSAATPPAKDLGELAGDIMIGEDDKGTDEVKHCASDDVEQVTAARELTAPGGSSSDDAGDSR